jgi:hypothetical protein
VHRDQSSEMLEMDVEPLRLNLSLVDPETAHWMWPCHPP